MNKPRKGHRRPDTPVDLPVTKTLTGLRAAVPRPVRIARARALATLATRFDARLSRAEAILDALEPSQQVDPPGL